MKRIGVIGLGNMGRPIARRIMGAGLYEVAVYDVDPAAVQALVAEGAIGCARPADVAMGADLVITVVPDGPDVEKVTLGEDGIYHAAREGMIHADFSTVHPKVSTYISGEGKKRGVRVLDACMMRSVPQAQAGTLGLMVGGAAEDLEACRPVFERIAVDIVHCGPNGAGAAMKVVNNMLAGVIMASTIEAMVLGAKAGVPIDVMLTVFGLSNAKNGSLDAAIKPTVLTRAFQPAHFALDLLHKDTRLALELANEVGAAVPVAAVVQQLRSAARAKGRGRWDAAAIATIFEELADIELRAEAPAAPTGA